MADMPHANTDAYVTSSKSIDQVREQA
jgi:hypothetical protein